MLKSSSNWTWGERGVENWMEEEGKRVASGETKGRGDVVKINDARACTRLEQWMGGKRRNLGWQADYIIVPQGSFLK